MSPVVNLTVKKERYEGDFRFQHVFIRVNSESLAFYGEQAETVEEKTLDHKLGNNYQSWPIKNSILLATWLSDMLLHSMFFIFSSTL